MIRLPKSVVTLIAAGATAAVIATSFVGTKEGLALVAYQDSVKVWTICYGHTHGVQPGQKATKEECDSLRASEVGKTLSEVDRLVTVPMSEARRAAVTSFAYNVGTGALARSTFLQKLNAGHPKACDEILRWVFAGGKDCRDPANDCAGIVTRREQEAQLCRL